MAEEWNPPPFGDISSDELVTAAYLNQLGNSLRFLKEVAYTEFTADVPVSATVEATPNDIVSAGAITYESVPHLIEFYSSGVAPGTGNTTILHLWDDTTEIGRIAECVDSLGPVFTKTRLTPTAASHTYKVRAHRVTGNGTVRAGTGGTDNMPGYIRITRIPT